MSTIREQILQEITARLAGTDGVGGRVYRSRAEAASRAETPCLLITPLLDTAEPGAAIDREDRKLLVRVGVIVHDDTPDRAADPLIVDLHRRLIVAGDCTLGGLAVDISQSGDNFTMAESDGVIAVDYTVFYRCGYSVAGRSASALPLTGSASATVRIAGSSGQGLSILGAATGSAGEAGATPLPEIIVLVNPSSTAEDGTTNLVFTFSRSGDTSLPLTVDYTIAGTATAGVDYQ